VLGRNSRHRTTRDAEQTQGYLACTRLACAETISDVRGRLGLPLAAVVALAVGCGEQQPVRISGTPEPNHAQEVERNPYALTCNDLARQPLHPDSARLVIHAEFALAQDPALRRVVAKETLNRTGRSVYYALTEICKGRDPSFRPARLAVESVRRGEYRAARNRPG